MSQIFAMENVNGKIDLCSSNNSLNTYDTNSDSSSVGFNSTSEGMSSSTSSRYNSSTDEDYRSDEYDEEQDTDYGGFHYFVFFFFRIKVSQLFAFIFIKAKLSKAIINGNIDLVKKAIVIDGIDINHIYDREQNYSFLHLACLMGQSEIIK